MPCNASYTRFIFGKFFSYKLQLDMHSYLHKNFILAKSGCYKTSNASSKAIESTSEETTCLMGLAVNLMQTMHTQQRMQRKQQCNTHRERKYMQTQGEANHRSL
jgi:hypothetical protein